MSAHVPVLRKITSLILTVSLLISAGVAYDKQRAIKQAYYAKKIAVLRAESAAQEAAKNPIGIDASGFDESAEGRNACATTSPPEGFMNCNSVDSGGSRSVVNSVIGRLNNPIVPISDEAEVHAIGVYSDGKIIVDVDYPERPIVLVLTAYGSVKWDIKVHPDTKIERLIISGYNMQFYQGITASTPVEMYTYKPSTCSTACWHREGYFYAYDLINAKIKLNHKIQSITGKRINSFQGEYAGKSFKIHSGIQQLDD